MAKSSKVLKERKVEVFIVSKMVVSIKHGLKMAKLMERDDKFGKLEFIMKENTKIIKCMEKD